MNNKIASNRPEYISQSTAPYKVTLKEVGKIANCMEELTRNFCNEYKDDLPSVEAFYEILRSYTNHDYKMDELRERGLLPWNQRHDDEKKVSE